MANLLEEKNKKDELERQYRIEVLKKLTSQEDEINTKNKEIEQLKNVRSALGLFKRKEKMEIDAKIETLERELANLQKNIWKLRIQMEK